MKNEKYLKLYRNFKNAENRILNSNFEFIRFLNTAAHNYRQDYRNAVLIYSQLPEASAIMSYDQWQKIYGRVPRKYSKAILLFDVSTDGKYNVVFDYSKTVALKSPPSNVKEIKFFDYNITEDTTSAIKDLYSEYASEENVSDIFYNTVKDNVISRNFSEQEEVKELYAKAVTNMLMKRFGESPPFNNLLSEIGKISDSELENYYNVIMFLFREQFQKLAKALPDYISVSETTKSATSDKDTEIMLSEKIPTEETNYSVESKQSPTIVTQSEIDEIIKYGPIVENAKFRIFAYFTANNHSSKDKYKFLANEYGISGWTFVTMLNHTVFINTNSLGITISDNNYENEITVNYREVSKRLDEIIAKGEYLSSKERERYVDYAYNTDENLSTLLSTNTTNTLSLRYYVGNSVTINNSDCMITDISNDEVTITQPSAPLFRESFSTSRFENLLLLNLDENLHLISNNSDLLELEFGFSGSGLLREFMAENFPDNKIPFALGNSLLEFLDEKQHIEREIESLNVGYYDKTDFKITAKINGEDYGYKGRFDIGDGRENGNGSLIEHIESYLTYLTVNNPYDEDSDSLSKKRDYLEVAIPYFKKHSQLTDEEQKLLDNFKTQNSIITSERKIENHTETQELSNEAYNDENFNADGTNSDLIGKVVEYEGKSYRVSSINHFGQRATIETITLESQNEASTLNVLPTETIRNLIDAQLPKADNYVITDNNLGAGTPLQRYNNNIVAIKLLNTINSEQRRATPEEQHILSRYVGWGGLSESFKNETRNAEIQSILSSADYDSAKASTLTSFYTPPIVIRSIYNALTNMGFTNGSILDPACGTGHFFGMLPEHMNQCKLYGVELDNVSGKIAQQLYPTANIAIQGFEDTNIPDNYIDVAIGNVPFDNISVFDKAYNKHNLKIHDYFFVKTLDKVRPGGIVAFITSKGTLDKKNTEIRKMIAEKAELLGAIRLPNNTFSKAAGTDVTSDIIFLQKREKALTNAEYPDWINTSANKDGIVINNYFVNHPEMICGHIEMQSSRFGYDSVCVMENNVSLSALLSSAISHIKGEYKPYDIEVIDNNTQSEAIAAVPEARNYSFYVDKSDNIYYRENGVMYLSSITGKKAERIKGMVALTDTARTLIRSEADNESDDVISPLRAKLNEQYDAFVVNNGVLNSFANSCFKNDNSYSLLLSLENVIKNDNSTNLEVEKADIFYKRTISPFIEITSAESAEEALIISMSQRGKVDIVYMATLTGDTSDKIISELLGDKIFKSPYENSYVTADEYLSGNVRKKLRLAKIAEKEDTTYKANVTALEKVLPADIPASGISVHLGTTWIPVEYINQFMYETFNVIFNRSFIKVEYLPYSGNYYINGKTLDTDSVEAYTKFGSKRRNSYQILEDCLNLRTSKVYDTLYDNEGKPYYVINEKETVIAQGHQEQLKAHFENWIWKDPDRRRTLTRLYNDKFNCIVNRSYDGSHLTFPGINPNIKLYPHQLNAIARMLYGGNTLLSHCVGAGKTFEMIAGAMKLKELGIVNKSLIVVPKHLTGQTGAEFLRLYPAANILVADEKDFTPQNRKRFTTRIATGDYDAIIIGHTQFDKIPLRAETQAEILREELNEIIDNLAAAKTNDMAKATTKSLERSKKSVENKLKELESRSTKDDVITFEELGVDQIFIDEAHYFKNLFLYTKMSNVSGVGSGTESGRASDLYGKIKYLTRLNPGKGIVFATGTPISNTMSEMFTMQRYLQPQVLKSMDLINFDSWATTFGEAVTAMELAPEGNTYRIKTRFAKFNNVPELISMFREFADVQTADMLKLPVPEEERTVVEVSPTEEQEEIIEILGERAEQIRHREVQPTEDNMLKITSDGRAIALDPRVYNPDAMPGKKIRACADNIYKIWCQSTDKTQIVFCDLSTSSVGKKEAKPYCAYDDLKNSLISLGIPADEVQFIQHYSTAKAKEKLFDSVRSGKVRIIVGSTSMMGTGTNIQDKLIALHHLDCPYRPADIEQREGRIIRQGNQNKKVHIFNYVTKGTFDAYMYQMVERKQKFISSIMTSKHITDRSVEDVDEVVLNYAQIKAIASGNPLVQKKFEIDSQVSKLAALRNDFIDAHHALEDEVQVHLPERIRSLEKNIQKYKEDCEFAKAHTISDDTFSITINGSVYTDKKAAIEELFSLENETMPGELNEIGVFRGFRLFMYKEMVGNLLYNLCLTVKNNLGYRVKLSKSVGTRNFFNISDVIDRGTKNKLNSAIEELDNCKQRLKSAQEEIKEEFPKEAEYQKLLNEQAEINAQLTVTDTSVLNEKPVETADTVNPNAIPHMRR